MKRAHRILTVDDEEVNLDLIEALLTPAGYEVVTACNGKEALETLARKNIDLILLDINMPVMDGFEVCRRVKQDPRSRHIPVIMLTALADHESRMRGMEAGAEEFLHKPADHAELLLRVGNMLRAAEYEDAFNYAIMALARAAEANDLDTGNHILRVGEFSAHIARELGQSDKFVEDIRLQATLHDVGKVHIPSHILKKPGRLTAGEMEEMKKHPAFGAAIIGEHLHLAMGRSIALNHHEKYDGTGYPAGLKGEAIPLEARIVTLADCYDALRNSRIYKPCYDHRGAWNIITGGDDRIQPSNFDPAILEIFKKTAARFEELYNSMKDLKAL
ncbi:MAG TPA: response regulator [Elusimicrobiales bacterium]|nr:response regulator [Elusimicrobiales bacterium]